MKLFFAPWDLDVIKPNGICVGALLLLYGARTTRPVVPLVLTWMAGWTGNDELSHQCQGSPKDESIMNGGSCQDLHGNSQIMIMIWGAMLNRWKLEEVIVKMI